MREKKTEDADAAPATGVRRPLVGAQIRRLRSERELTLTSMAELTGLSVGYLSRVETDKVSPSLETLALLSNALGVPITWLMVESVPPLRVVRREERRRIDGLEDTTVRVTATAPAPLADSGHIEVINGSIQASVHIVEMVLAPGVVPSHRTHAGEEHCIVLKGHLRFSQGEIDVDAEPGDYIFWDATFPHAIANVGKEEGRMLVVRYAAEGLPQP